MSLQGIVNLTDTGEKSRRSFSLCGLKTCDLVPDVHGGGPQFPMMIGWNIVTWNREEVGDRIMNGNETLEMSG